jgi:hypothetical protein
MRMDLNLDKTPAQEKAEELIDNMFFCYQGHIDMYTAIQCAFVAVKEIYNLDLKNGFYLITDKDKEMYYSFWEDVNDALIAINRQKIDK